MSNVGQTRVQCLNDMYVQCRADKISMFERHVCPMKGKQDFNVWMTCKPM